MIETYRQTADDIKWGGKLPHLCAVCGIDCSNRFFLVSASRLGPASKEDKYYCRDHIPKGKGK